MFKNQPKQTLIVILAGIMMVSFSVMSCNNESGDKKEEATADSLAAPAPVVQEEAPKMADTPVVTMDTGASKPIKPAP